MDKPRELRIKQAAREVLNDSLLLVGLLALAIRSSVQGSSLSKVQLI